MADDPNSTKPDSCARPRSPDHARTEPTSGTPRSTPTEPTWWPADSYGLIFLPRFVEKIGLRAFPDWTGAEATMEQQLVRLPELAAANMYPRIYADNLLRKHRPDLTPWPYLDFAFGSGNHKLWPIAQQLAKHEYNEAAPALRRLRSVWDEIRRHSLTKKLALKIHKIPGGPWKEFDPAWWDGNRPDNLFDCGTIDPEYPFGERPSWEGNNDHWIFAPYEGIDQIMAALAPAQGAFKVQSKTPPPATQPNEQTVADSAPGDSEPVTAKKRVKRQTKKRVKRRAKKQVKRRGPDRFSKSDRALYPAITKLIKKEQLSPQEAAQRLGDLGKIEGRGSANSRKLRLARRYRKEVQKH